jgi:hypothetical protein
MSRYILESIGVAYLSPLLAYVVQYALLLLLGGHQWIAAVIAPTFLLPIASGAFAAYLMRKRLSKGPYFVWCIPLVLLCLAFFAVINAPYATPSEVWDTMIGTDCSSSECAYEALFSVPFVCALSYSASCSIMQAIRKRRVISAPNLP